MRAHSQTTGAWVIRRWRLDSNERRPHDALGGRTPAESMNPNPESSTLELSRMVALTEKITFRPTTKIPKKEIIKGLTYAFVKRRIRNSFTVL